MPCHARTDSRSKRKWAPLVVDPRQGGILGAAVDTEGRKVIVISVLGAVGKGLCTDVPMGAIAGTRFEYSALCEVGIFSIAPSKERNHKKDPIR